MLLGISLNRLFLMYFVRSTQEPHTSLERVIFKLPKDYLKLKSNEISSVYLWVTLRKSIVCLFIRLEIYKIPPGRAAVFKLFTVIQGRTQIQQ